MRKLLIGLAAVLVLVLPNAQAAQAGGGGLVLSGHTDSVMAVAWSPDSRLLASGSMDGTVRLWNKAGDSVSTLNIGSPVYCLAWAPGGKTIAVCAGSVQLWDLKGNKLADFPSVDSPPLTLAWSSNGKQIVYGTGDKSGRPHHYLRLINAKDGSPEGVLLYGVQSLDEVAYLPGNKLGGVSVGGIVGLWDSTGRLLNIFFGPETGASGAWSHNGKLFALGATQITLYSPIGVPVQKLEGKTEGVWAMAWSRDDSLFAASFQDKSIHIWSAAGTLLQTLTAHTHFVSSLAFSPDGTTLASGSYDKTAHLWSVPKP
jgi:WD40 repeat protein